MQSPGWVPQGVDTERPNVARVYDALLGGTHNFAADRDFARTLEAIEPTARAIARENRAFLSRAVRFLVEEMGIRQFLDIGSGIPTRGNVHEVAQLAAPDARVVYVDIDRVAVAHSRAILDGNDRATAIQGDLRRPEEILKHPEVRELLDFDQPMAVLLLALLHFVSTEENPAAIVAQFRDVLAPGSYLAVSHAAHDDSPEMAAAMEAVSRRTAVPAEPRTKSQIQKLFFRGFELVDPGLVNLPQWRPDSPEQEEQQPGRLWLYAGVGRKA